MTTLKDYCDQGQKLTLSDGATVFSPGDESSVFFIVTNGAVRVEQTNSAGRTVVLYRVGAGDSCVLTATCLLSGHAYAAFGHAEGEVEAYALAPETFRRLLRVDPAFQTRVIGGFAARVGELTGVIDDLLEHRTDLRLARWLAGRTVGAVEMTQTEIAQELGTAREVVSRALKAFQTRGWVRLERGKVHVLSLEALRRHGTQATM